MIKQLCLIGVGMIGGSLALSLRNTGFCEEIVGFDLDTDSLESAVDMGVIDRFADNAVAAVEDADIVVLAVPLGAMESVLREIKPGLKPGATVTDTGSAKQCFLDAARIVFGEVPASLVPGHPIAGRASSGVSASTEGLYADKKVILTPLEGTDAQSLKRVSDMWLSTGAIVEEMNAATHDQFLASTSHLPHVLAFAITEMLANSEKAEEIFAFAGSGFKGFTRIASSDPVMWRDICLQNPQAILESITAFEQTLGELKQYITEANGTALFETFSHAKSKRDDLMKS